MRRFLARLRRESTSDMREYDSFESALRDSDSYEDPRLIEVVKEKTKLFSEALQSDAGHTTPTRQTIQNLDVLRSVELNQPLDVLEIGGACGASYFETQHFAPGRIRHWSIVETPAMATAGESLTNDPNLSFHSDFTSAVRRLASRDLAVAQGVLQYTPDPVQTLNDLIALEFSYVYITRTAVAKVDRPIFTRQDTELEAHGPGRLPNAPSGQSSQPMTLVNVEALLSAIPANYEVVSRFEESEQRTLSIAGRSVLVRDVGFLASKL